MNKQNNNGQLISDEQIDSAYLQALHGLEPEPAIDQQILQQAKLRRSRGRDWASFPIWARAASVAGVAILGWWLWQPQIEPLSNQHANTDMADGVQRSRTTHKQSIPVTITDTMPEIYAEPEQADSVDFTLAAPSAKPEALAKSEVQRQQERQAVAQHKLQQSQRMMTQQNKQLKFSFCLQYKLVGEKELVMTQHVPAGANVATLLAGPVIEWQQQQWHLFEHESLYLVRAQDDGLIFAEVSEQALAACNSYR